jgi:hypothetical protein
MSGSVRGHLFATPIPTKKSHTPKLCSFPYKFGVQVHLILRKIIHGYPNLLTSLLPFLYGVLGVKLRNGPHYPSNLPKTSLPTSATRT